MNRPGSLNALNVELLDALIAALGTASADENVRVVVLTGSGRGFSSGQDLNELTAGEQAVDIASHIERYYVPLIQRLQSCPKPTVARVNGIAAGAGASLALACDFKLAAKSARFSQAFVRLGLVPDSGSTYFLVRMLGRTRALELMLLGRPMTAEEALSAGLINRIADIDALDELTQDFVRELASGPMLAFKLIKEAVRRAENASLDQILSLETEFQSLAAASPDYRRALEAFLNKEPPVFFRS
jgi:2-(1,2-epoxy-1,2-dihydrophenyl)acetyl-CoA isomerase